MRKLFNLDSDQRFKLGLVVFVFNIILTAALVITKNENIFVFELVIFFLLILVVLGEITIGSILVSLTFVFGSFVSGSALAVGLAKLNTNYKKVKDLNLTDIVILKNEAGYSKSLCGRDITSKDIICIPERKIENFTINNEGRIIITKKANLIQLKPEKEYENVLKEKYIIK